MKTTILILCSFFSIVPLNATGKDRSKNAYCQKNNKTINGSKKASELLRLIKNDTKENYQNSPLSDKKLELTKEYLK